MIHIFHTTLNERELFDCVKSGEYGADPSFDLPKSPRLISVHSSILDIKGKLEILQGLQPGLYDRKVIFSIASDGTIDLLIDDQDSPACNNYHSSLITKMLGQYLNSRVQVFELPSEVTAHQLHNAILKCPIILTPSEAKAPESKEEARPSQGYNYKEIILDILKLIFSPLISLYECMKDSLCRNNGGNDSSES